MGVSKAMMKKIVCSQNEFDGGGTIFCCVRYGNVMGSRGSVIPLFLDLIRRDVPLTLTVPSMTRFLMTLDQSVDLVLHAMTRSRDGARYLCAGRLPAQCRPSRRPCASRYSPRKSGHPLKEVGIRPGEKIYEILVNEYEMRVTEEPTYFTVHPEYRVPKRLSLQPLGSEYTSANTRQLTQPGEIGELLDMMGQVEVYI